MVSQGLYLVIFSVCVDLKLRWTEKTSKNKYKNKKTPNKFWSFYIWYSSEILKLLTSLWKPLCKERHKVEATFLGSLFFYPKHLCIYIINNYLEIPMVSVIISIHGALNFSLRFACRNVSACRSFQHKTHALKSQIVPVILTAQCDPCLKLLMRL